MALNRRQVALLPMALGMSAPWAGWAQTAGPQMAAPAAGEVTQADPHAWLEALEAPDALAWVTARNTEALALIGQEPDFMRRQRETLARLGASANISYPSPQGDHLYHFYRSAARPHGIWRRTTLEGYAKTRPDWETLLDVDALAKTEARNWVFAFAAVQAASGRALVFLSLAGEDRQEMREFDLASRSFVAGGFRAPPAKLMVAWWNADELLIATDTGPGSLTASGYPRAVRRWRRGTALADAPLLLQGEPADMMITPGYSRREGLPPAALLHRRIRFFEWERHLLREDGSMVRLDLPLDADAWLDRDWLVLELRGGWSAGARAFTPGSVLVLPLAQATSAERPWQLLLEGQPRRRLVRADALKDGYLVAWTDNLRPQLTWHRWNGQSFASAALPVPAAGVVTIGAHRPQADNRYWLTTQAPLAPQALALHDAPTGTTGTTAPMKRQAAAFDASAMRLRQYEARSADGTLVPYTVLGPTLPTDAAAPTLLYGYGGFGIPLELDYQQLPGINWLQYGGTYVLAHIRGGGEFGNAWYLAAKGSRRQSAFDDFTAVAQDLVARGITQPKRLGIYGASNGGALVTAVMVQRPELFGAVVSRVPLTDMLGFTRLSAGPSWAEEYGDPAVPAERAALALWSPYQNARSTASGAIYPPVLFLGNRNDDRVHPAHARKMVAQLHALGHRRAWLYEEATGGHSGRSEPKIHALREAMVYSFLRQQLKVADSA